MSPSLTRAALVALLAVVGCRSSALYTWPDYEASVRATCTDFQDVDLPEHVESFARQVESIETAGEHVGPGIHAHLGYLYYLSGDAAAAQREFELERRLFPESAVFIDGMVQRMRR